jgi:hypothetical protein
MNCVMNSFGETPIADSFGETALANSYDELLSQTASMTNC